MLRYQADRKTVLWMAATTVLLIAQWRFGRVHWGLYGPYVYLSVAVAVIAHNHNHVRLWHHPGLNALTEVWLTLFYGFPIFAWVPTHNQNHHKYHTQHRPRLHENVAGVGRQPPGRAADLSHDGVLGVTGGKFAVFHTAIDLSDLA